MDYYYRILGMVLITVMLCCAVPKNISELRMVLVICGFLAVAWFIVYLLEPIIGFMRELSEIGTFTNEYTVILFKITGICILSQLAVLICSDSGNASMGKILQLSSNVIVIYLGIPIFQSLLGILQEILRKAA